MNLGGQLRSRVTAIKRDGKKKLDDDVRRLWGLEADAHGQLVRTNDPNTPLPEEDLSPYQRKYDIWLQDIESLASRFEAYCDLDPFQLNAAVAGLGGPHGGFFSASKRLFHADDDWMRACPALVDEQIWAGKAARAFRTGFLEPFHKASRRQRLCVNILFAAVSVFHDTAKETGRNLITLADTVIARLNGETEGDDAARVLSFASIISGCIGLVLPTGVSQVAGVVSLGTGIASMFVGSKGEDTPWHVAGGECWTIVASAWDQLTKLEKSLAEHDDKFYKGLHEDRFSDEAFQHPGLTPHRPDVADDRSSLERGNHLYETSGDVLIGELVSIYEAGYRNLPAAAGQYAAARAKMADAAAPAWLAQLFPRADAEYDKIRAEFKTKLGGVERALEDCGASLVTVAENYRLTDADNARFTAAIKEIDPPPAEPKPRGGAW